MSHYYGLWCVDCKAVSGDVNRAKDQLVVILKWRRLLGDLMNAAEKLPGELDVSVTVHMEYCSEDPDPAEFAGRHAEHHLQILDEYGIFYDETGQQLPTPDAL